MNARSSLDNIFEIAALFPSPTRQGEKGGNFKTSMRFTETNPFLYCLSSSTDGTFVLDLLYSIWRNKMIYIN